MGCLKEVKHPGRLMMGFENVKLRTQDAEKLCKNLPSGSSLLSCLRSKKEQLTEACSAEVFQRQTDAADDWRTDVELHKACKVSVLQLPGMCWCKARAWLSLVCIWGGKIEVRGVLHGERWRNFDVAGCTGSAGCG